MTLHSLQLRGGGGQREGGNQTVIKHPTKHHNALHLFRFIHTTTLQSRWFCPGFTDDETEAQAD